MTISSFLSVLESPLLAQLLVLAGILTLYIYLRKKDAEGQFSAFMALLALLAARDALAAFFPIPELGRLADLILFGFVTYLYLSPRRRDRGWLAAALALSFLASGALVLGLFLEPLAAVPGWAYGIPPILDLALVAWLSIRGARDADTPAKQVVAQSWPFAAGFLLAYSICALVLGHASPVFQRLVVPLSYGWLVAVALTSIRQQDSEMVKAVSYYEGSVDSLYNLFMSTGTVLKGSFTTEEVLKSMNEAMVAETGAGGGVIFLVDEFDDLIVCKAYSGLYPPPIALPESLPRKANRVESFMKHAQFRLGETLFGEVAKTGKNLYIADTAGDGRVVISGDEPFLRISSFMAVPLMFEDKIIGVASVVKSAAGEHFSEEDYDRFKLLANFGTLAVSNFFSFLEANERSGLEQSAGIAAEIQRTVLPKKLPQFPRLALGAFSTPALGVSGDYYDVIQTRKDRIVAVVGDVAGKGVSAALIMVMIRSILHLITNTNKDIATVLDWVNRGITGKIDMDHYATLGIVAVNVDTGEMEYANASHQPLLLYRRATESIETIEVKSVPIGVERDSEYVRKALRLADGDIVVMYTDGIVEAMNEQGKQYGRKSLSQAIIRHRDLAPKEIVTKIKGDLESFVGSVRQHDDQTVLILKMKQ